MLTEDIMHPWKETRLVEVSKHQISHLNEKDQTYLKPSHKEPIRSQFSIRVGTILYQRENPPSNIHKRNDPGHGKPGEQVREGKLADHSTNGIHGL
jgi:hypothetical protein